MQQASRDRIGRRGIAKIMVSLFVLFLTLMFYVWSRYHAAKLGYELSENSSKERRLLEEQRGLTLELNRLSSLDRIESIARKKLGLAEPRTEQVVYVDLKKP